MPIYSRLRNSSFGPDEIRIIGDAFEATCAKLGLAHREDPLWDMVAKAIGKCAETGERDPIRLQEYAETALNR
jgi:hypothetical protein